MSGFLSGFRTGIPFWNWSGYWFRCQWKKESQLDFETSCRILIQTDCPLLSLSVFLCSRGILFQFLCP